MITKRTFSKGLLIGVLIANMAFMTACNPTTAVNAIGAVANVFLSNCGTFTSNPADAAACQAINTAVQATVTEFDAAYNAYVGSGGNTASNWARLEAAITAALKNLPAALTAYRITNPTSQNKILGEIELIVSAFILIAGFFGVSVPASVHLRASLNTVKKGDWRAADKQASQIKKLWNQSVCGGLTGSQFTQCKVR